MAVTPVGSAASVYGAEKISKSPEQQLNEYRSEREELKKQLSYDDSPNLRNRLDTLDKRIENLEKRTGGREECETCKNRKYQDGSDDPGVSFKTPSNIAPEEAAARVRSHENEHVYRNRANSYFKNICMPGMRNTLCVRRSDGYSNKNKTGQAVQCWSS